MSEIQHITGCPFCLNADHPLVFFASEYFRAIYNRAPILPGHTLVVPARHVAALDDLTITELEHIMVFTRKVNHIIGKLFPNEGFNWTLQDGQPAGQTIEHLHVHIIPRTEGDLPEPGDWYPKLQASKEKLIDSFTRPQHTEKELIHITEKLKSAAISNSNDFQS
ncbi:HIT family protein [Salinivirga cyanobacteriivorans]